MKRKVFDIVRYKQLLLLQENDEISFSDLELLSFEASIEKQISYNRKEIYLTLINKYLNLIISPYEFRSKFLEIEKEDCRKSTEILQDFEKLKVFTFTEDLEKFSDLINEIATLCAEHDVSWHKTLKPISENKFYYLIKKNYIQFNTFPFGVAI